jgi:uncharacterized SAM-binding protein YcdF (DUF218 family)
VSRTRLIAVCGYSDGRGEGLHAICARRLRRAEEEALPSDVIFLTGWSRGKSRPSEAEEMARSWAVPCRRIVVDPEARSTLANAVAVARLVRRLEADDVLLVTPSWHARRARALLRAALRGTSSRVEVATSDERPSSSTRLRELGCWLLVPFTSLVAGRSGRDTRADGV